MSQLTKEDYALIEHVCQHSGKSESEAIDYLDRFCGDWRGTPVPEATRIESLNSEESQ